MPLIIDVDLTGMKIIKIKKGRRDKLFLIVKEQNLKEFS